MLMLLNRLMNLKNYNDTAILPQLQKFSMWGVQVGRRAVNFSGSMALAVKLRRADERMFASNSCSVIMFPCENADAVAEESVKFFRLGKRLNLTASKSLLNLWRSSDFLSYRRVLRKKSVRRHSSWRFLPHEQKNLSIFSENNEIKLLLRLEWIFFPFIAYLFMWNSSLPKIGGSDLQK